MYYVLSACVMQSIGDCCNVVFIIKVSVWSGTPNVLCMVGYGFRTCGIIGRKWWMLCCWFILL